MRAVEPPPGDAHVGGLGEMDAVPLERRRRIRAHGCARLAAPDSEMDAVAGDEGRATVQPCHIPL